jgi:hypothetical protein
VTAEVDYEAARLMRLERAMLETLNELRQVRQERDDHVKALGDVKANSRALCAENDRLLAEIERLKQGMRDLADGAE